MNRPNGIVFSVSGTHPESGEYSVDCESMEAAQHKALLFTRLGFEDVSVRPRRVSPAPSQDQPIQESLTVSSRNKPATPDRGDAFHSLVALDGSMRQVRPSPEMEAYLRYIGLIESSPISRLPVRTPKGEALVAAAIAGVSPTDSLDE
jgi:hypothetical protein